MTADRPATQEDRPFQLACVEAGGHVLGIDVRKVREIVHVRPLTPLPAAPRLIEGLVELRGSVIPVVDLGRALGGSPAPEHFRARIVVVEEDGLLFGLRVAAALDVLRADPSAIHPAPPLATQAGYDAVRCIVRRSNAPPVSVLSLPALRSRIGEVGQEGPAPESCSGAPEGSVEPARCR